MCRIKSLPLTGGFRAPVRLKRSAVGTLNQVSPVAMAQAKSVLPTPVAKAPSAP